jgi:hypothetical protein
VLRKPKEISPLHPSDFARIEQKIFDNIRYAMMHSPAWDTLVSQQRAILETCAKKQAAVLMGTHKNYWGDLAKVGDWR